MNIYEKMLAITADVQNIEKHGHNTFSNYDYVKASDVVAGVQKAIIEHKVFIQISEENVTFSAEPKDKGGFNHYSDLKAKATFINAEKPEERFDVVYYSRASDSGDKDIYKAKTNGLKYLYTQQFMLVTDVLIDAEEDKGKPESKQESKKTDYKQEAIQKQKEKGGNCDTCGVEITKAEADYSVKKCNGSMLCRACQKTWKPVKGDNTPVDSKPPF